MEEDKQYRQSLGKLSDILAIHLTTYDKRSTFMTVIFPEVSQAMINLEGPPAVACYEMVSYLDRIGGNRIEHLSKEVHRIFEK